jgi:hypothetical protein
MRVFFDYTNHDESLYDYKGNEFPSDHAAIEFAEEMVNFLRDSLTGAWNGWSIEVRAADGKAISSLPVGNSTPIVA